MDSALPTPFGLCSDAHSS